MIELKDLPSINAALNSTCATLLLLGWVFIKNNKILAHRVAMTLAFTVSVIFLCSYLYYHSHAGVTRYTQQGWIRPVYFSILISHTILAALAAPMAITTFVLAARGRFERHKAWARWTWPVWMYVSVTGVVIYQMLY